MSDHERIWLHDGNEVTWCQDKIDDDDTEYVRADLYATLCDELRHKEEDCREISRCWKALGISNYTGKSVAEHVTELREQLAEAQALAYVPNIWVCDLCPLIMNVQTISMESGNIGTPTVQSIPECPNDGKPIRRQTWRENANSHADGNEHLLKERAEARKDAERLDWLERELAFHKLMNWCVKGPQWEFIGSRTPRVRYETAREAIDAAREAKE